MYKILVRVQRFGNTNVKSTPCRGRLFTGQVLEDVKGKHWSTFNKPKSSAMTKMMCGGRAAVPPVVVVVAQRLHKSSSELRSIVSML